MQTNTVILLILCAINMTLSIVLKNYQASLGWMCAMLLSALLLTHEHNQQ